MYKFILYIIFLLLSGLSVFSQEYSYVRYDTKEGLAGSNVYDLWQDKEGFMWFATENGVSRFDGTNFKNFTTKDGLSDNEVLKLFVDSKGRIWMLPFNNFICYYYEGKIHNQQNDSLLSRLHLSSIVKFIAEDEQHDILVMNAEQIILIKDDGRVKLIGNTDDFDNKYPDKTLGRKMFQYARKYENGKGFMISLSGLTYQLFNDTMHFLFKQKPLLPEIGPKGWNIIWNENHIKYIPDYPYNLDVGYSFKWYVSTSNGSYCFDSTREFIITRFLKGKKITHTKEDLENNIWFSSLGEGIYKLSSTEFKTWDFKQENDKGNSEVYTITKKGDEIIAGLNNSNYFTFKNDSIIANNNFRKYLQYSTNPGKTDRLFCSKKLASGVVIFGLDGELIRMDKEIKINPKICPVKSVDEINDNELLVATASSVIRVNSHDLSVIDTVWRNRGTKVISQDGNYYIGTLNGLYKINSGRPAVYLGTIHPALSRRITGLKISRDGTLWVATNDQGVLALKNDKVLINITKRSGLSTDICKCLFIDSHYLWVGTAEGLNRIDIEDSKFSITKYNTSDGLPSDNINAVYVEGNTVWVGSPAGLTYFNQDKISSTSRCDLKMLSIVVAEKTLPQNTTYQLAYKDNNIRFEYVAISFKSGGDILYQYKLDGLDTGWHETKQNSIAYAALTPGKYTFRLRASNKFGVQSHELAIPFSIETPWWRTPFFWVLVSLLSIAGIWFLINLRYRTVNRREDEKRALKQQISDLEQLAMRAQMNPHFIFNCLNSIQSFVINNDLEATNKYLNNFALLLRQTLDHSSNDSISIAAEINYISNYLELEKMRFGDKFGYAVHIDENIPADFTFIPNMILQPFVENSIRHGIRYKKEGTGMIEINFRQTENELLCSIADNGIGRKSAAEFKSNQHIEYQSKGIELTFQRLQLLSAGNNQKIITEIIDLVDEQGNGCGTEVLIRFPLSIIDKLNK